MTAIYKIPPAQSLHVEFIESLITSEEGRDVVRLNNTVLHSYYQPIYSFAHQRAIGYEGLIRPMDGNGDLILPSALFALAQSLEVKVLLDRLSRMLHVRNFIKQADTTGWLFLNVDPIVTTQGKQFGPYFKQLLERYGIPPHRVVIEILEGKIEDEALLAESVRYYRDIGCLIAIDDFGVGQSNFDRIWRIAPHIVKLDRSIIEQATTNKAVNRVLPSLVSLIHEAGSLALIEGVENEEQALIALQAGIDFVQGYYFCTPQPLLPDSTFHPAIAWLFDQFRHSNEVEEFSTRRGLAIYTEAFFNAARQIIEGVAIAVALEEFLLITNVRRCYLLDELGLQIGSNYSAQPLTETKDARFQPLDDARNAIWARRQYFQDAIAEPGRVHISKPYLSITGGELCVTLSIAGYHDGNLQVLCGDIDWADS